MIVDNCNVRYVHIIAKLAINSVACLVALIILEYGIQINVIALMEHLTMVYRYVLLVIYNVLLA